MKLVLLWLWCISVWVVDCFLPPGPGDCARRPLGRHMSALKAVSGFSIAGFALTNRVLNDGGEPPQVSLDAATIVKDLRINILSLYGRYMSADGRSVDYKALGASSEFEDFVRISQQLKWVDLGSLSVEDRKAAFINIYNSLIVHGLVIGPVPGNLVLRLNFYSSVSYILGGVVLSLDDIEHGVLRGNRAPLLKPGLLGDTQFAQDDPRCALAVPLDPRIHFALNCGARGCPPIRYYEADALDERLDLASRSFFRTVEVDVTGRVQLSQILKWYTRDFGDGSEEGMLRAIMPFLPDPQADKLRTLLQAGSPITVDYEPYDWSLNSAS